MYRVPLNFHKRLHRGEIPTPYIIIETHLGYRTYAEKELGGIFSSNPYFFDGSWTLDGSVTLGASSIQTLDKSGRVLRFGVPDMNLQSIKENVLASYQSKTLQHFTVEMDNADRYFAQIIAKEPFIGRPLSYWVGFEQDPQSEHIKRFSGVITEMTVMPVMILEADEE